jgi:hypothetical protein
VSRRAVIVVVGGLLAGCYHPAHEQACAVSCSAADRQCPDGTACGADLRCHIDGQADCSDAAVGDSDALSCYGNGVSQFDPMCGPVVSTAVLAIPADTGATIDTAADCDIVHPQLDGSLTCVKLATSIHVTGAVRVVGARPLVLLAIQDLTIDAAGSIDVASHQGQAPVGAGGNVATCATNEGTRDLGGGGGGAGGGMQGPGGGGGAGDNMGSLGGLATSIVQLPPVLRGGCKGSTGGGSPAGTTPSDAGDSGGAIYLIAGTALTVAGTIDASGGGAPGGTAKQGGGGGGSGGMIVLEAASLGASGIIFAHGGGGSGGAGDTASSPGNDPIAATAAAGAMGGAGTMSGGSSAGGFGGHGSTQASLAGLAGGSSVGAGTAAGAGGGGGAGYILIFAGSRSTAGAVITPSAI